MDLVYDYTSSCIGSYFTFNSIRKLGFIVIVITTTTIIIVEEGTINIIIITMLDINLEFDFNAVMIT